MQHAQIGFRSLGRTIDAAHSIYETVKQNGFRVDRYGICLNWSMGYPKAFRKGQPKGTGLILDSNEDFIQLSNTAPVAPLLEILFSACLQPLKIRQLHSKPAQLRLETLGNILHLNFLVGQTT